MLILASKDIYKSFHGLYLPNTYLWTHKFSQPRLRAININALLCFVKIDQPATPFPASTVVLMRDSPDCGLEVFMVERHHKMGFAAAARVFPGGRVDDADASLADGAGNSFQVAAIRETFEESGILLARAKESGNLVTPEHLASLQGFRSEINAGKIKFSDLLNSEKLTLAIDLLIPFAHWITPVNYPKRYNTHFYVARAANDHLGEHDGLESVDSLWITPSDALLDAERGRGKLEFATRLNLKKLTRWATTDDAITAAKSATIVTVQPVLSRPEKDIVASIPAEADYDGSTFLLEN